MIHRRRQTDRRRRTGTVRDGKEASSSEGDVRSDNKIQTRRSARRRHFLWSSWHSGPQGDSSGSRTSHLNTFKAKVIHQGRVNWRRPLGLLWAGVPLAFFLYSMRLTILLEDSDEPMPITLPLWEQSQHTMTPRLMFPSWSTLRELEPINRKDSDGMRMTGHSLQNVSDVHRTISESDEEEESEEYRAGLLEEYEDEDEYMPSSYYHKEELDYDECQRPRWRDLYNPNCNAFHEIDLHRLEGDHIPNFHVRMFSHGYFRDVWKVTPLDGSDPIVLKTTRWQHSFNHYYIGNVQRDATVMIVLSSSPRIVNIHGACAGSVSVAPAVGQLQLKFLPRDPFGDDATEPYINPRDLHDDDHVNPLNNLTATEKIDYALAFAEAIADLHGYEGGVIIHDDMTPDQWLVTETGDVLLGDFNRALVLDWNVETNEYCKTDEGRGFGFYRAPEEKLDWPQDEKIDVYSVGCQFYGLLTGLRPYYWNDWEGFKKKIKKGIRPYIDPRYRTRSFAEGELVKVMERCWEFHSEKRADIFEVIRRLRYIQAKIHVED